MNKIVSVNILTYNGEKFIEQCLKSVLRQTYQDFEVLVIDNNSKDDTVNIAKVILGEFKGNQMVIENKENLGFAAGHNLGIEESRGEYVLCLNQDVILDKDFVKYAVEAMEKDKEVGTIQGKIFQMNNGQKTEIIDTIGFAVFKSGKIIDIGHGEGDKREYDLSREVFGANGVAPFYRRIALNDIQLKKEYFDEDFFCYVEDVDLAWRLRWIGWKCLFMPGAVVWHDRTSSKKLGKGFHDFRILRKKQSLWIKMISWRNQWFLFIKNQSLVNFIIFFPYFIYRQAKLFLYILLFETNLLKCVKDVIKLTPKMLGKRKAIMKSRKITNREIMRWFKIR